MQQLSADKHPSLFWLFVCDDRKKVFMTSLLAVDSGIELPQLELVSNFTGDCTSVYSTGQLKLH
jgi:hypothetical protein